MTSPSIAVVIACRDGMPWLVDQLAALGRQRYDGSWEVVVADNGSTDGSVQAAHDFERDLPLTIVDASDTPGQSHARNTGAASTGSDLLLFVDQDDVVGDGYLEAMAHALAAHPIVAARIDTTKLNPDWVVDARPMVQTQSLGAGPMPYAAGGSLGIRRDVFEAVGGFDPAMPGAAEDVDLCWRAQLTTGEPMGYATDAVLHYRLRSTMRDIARQAYGHGRALVALYVRYGHLDGRRSLREVARRWGWAFASLVKRPSRTTVGRIVWLAAHQAGVVREALRRRVVFL